MANKEKGEVALDVDGKTYTLVFSTNTICEMEGVLNLGINEITTFLSGARIRITVLRAALWAALQDRHPEVTLKAAGDLIQKMKADKVLEKIAEAIKSAHPDQEDGENPPKPGQVTTGPAR